MVLMNNGRLPYSVAAIYTVSKSFSLKFFNSCHG
jgi:hypothetical protein